MDTRRIVLGGTLSVVTLLAACGSIPINPPGPPGPPKPTPTPPPAQQIPEPQCAAGQTYGCWHWPPDSTMPLYACPVYDAAGGVAGVVNVTGGPAQCPAKPTDPGPGPTPPPTSCSPKLDPALLPPLNSDSWTDAGSSSTFTALVNESVKAAQAACPEVWKQPSSPTSCLTAVGKIDQGYLLVSKQLQLRGVRAAQAVDASGRLYDHLYVCTSETVCESWKLFEYTGACLTGNPYKGTYRSPSGPTPPPDPGPTPPPAGACTAPLPPKVWTAETLPDGWGQDQVGQPRWELGCTAHGNVIDCTAKVAPHACEYCAAIGMGEAGGQIRCGCPVRNECKPEGDLPQNFKCHERVACETYLTGGTRLEAKEGSGVTCSFANDNPFQFHPSDGKCRLCSVGDPRVCGGWF